MGTLWILLPSWNLQNYIPNEPEQLIYDESLNPIVPQNYSDSNESGDDYSASNERDEVDSHHTKDIGTDYMVTSDQAPSSLKYPSKVITTKEI